MKKTTKTLFIGVLSALALVGCNKTATSSEADSTSSTGTSDSQAAEVSSSSAKPASTENYLEPYEVNLALENYQVTFASSSQTVDVYGKNACYIDSGTSSVGYIYFNNSVWEYGLDDGVSLENCIYGSMSDEYDLSDLLTFYSAIKTLADDTTGANWEEAKSSHTYTTTDEDTIAAILTLGGYSTTSSSYYSVSYSADSLTMKSKKNGSVSITGTVNISYTSSYFGSSTETEKLSILLSNIGDNTNDDIDTFLANPTVPTQTGFSDAMKGYMTTYTGEVLPYDDKFTAYSSSSLESSSYSSSSYYVYQDFKCGDLVSEYGALLEAKGFIKETTESDSTDSSSSVTSSATYYKVKSAKTATKGEVDAVVSLVYYSKSDLASMGYDALYQDGLFMIQGSMVEQALTLDNVTDINAFVAGNIKDASGSAIIPAFSFTATPTSISLTDYTSYLASYYSMTAYYMISGAFSTAEEALTNMTTWANSLVTAGFVYQDTSDSTDSSTSAASQADLALSETNRTVALTYGDADDSTSQYIVVNITLDPGTDGSYNGDFAINIMAF
jgi:hypothetical protein